MIGSVDEDGSSAGRPSRTTYLSELLAPVERLADLPPEPEPDVGLAALTWAFALVAVAALIVCGLIVFDVVRAGQAAATMSPGARSAPVACSDAAPCLGAR